MLAGAITIWAFKDASLAIPTITSRPPDCKVHQGIEDVRMHAAATYTRLIRASSLRDAAYTGASEEKDAVAWDKSYADCA